jgi:hypothetical protein
VSRVTHKIMSPPTKVCEILSDLASIQWAMDTTVWAQVRIRPEGNRARFNCRCQLEHRSEGMATLQDVELVGFEFSEFEDVGDGVYWVGFCKRCAMVYWGRT